MDNINTVRPPVGAMSDHQGQQAPQQERNPQQQNPAQEPQPQSAAVVSVGAGASGQPVPDYLHGYHHIRMPVKIYEHDIRYGLGATTHSVAENAPVTALIPVSKSA